MPSYLATAGCRSAWQHSHLRRLLRYGYCDSTSPGAAVPALCPVVAKPELLAVVRWLVYTRAMGSFSRKLKKPHMARAAATNIVRAVAELHRLLQSSKDLAAITRHFDDTLVSNDQFMLMGGPRHNDILLSMVLVALKVSITAEAPKQSQLFYVPEWQLWHGYLLFEGGILARVIHFDDINRGVCSVAGSDDGMAHHFRFSIPEGTTEPLDPAQAELAGFTRRGPTEGKPS